MMPIIGKDTWIKHLHVLDTVILESKLEVLKACKPHN